MASVLVLLGTVCLYSYIKLHFLEAQTQTFPVNQLERGFVSRKRALQHMGDLLTRLRMQQQSITSLDQSELRTNQSEILTELSTDLEIVQSLGLKSLNRHIDMLLGRDSEAEKSEEDEKPSVRNNSFSRHIVTPRFCYTTANSPQGIQRQVDPSFCTRLIDLFNDIQRGDQPSLLTIFTWLPDPLYDADRLRRRVLFENWTLLRPIVQPVLFTDSRVYMALANAFDWPCFPVSRYSKQGVPVFKDMARTVAQKFNSTFYGYVRATTVFDASLVETLLKVKETYVDKLTGNWTQLIGNSKDNVHNMKPVLVYGRSLKANNLGSMKSLEYLCQTVNTTEGHDWPERKESLTYFFYSNLDFSDIPDLIVEDKYLTSQLVSRSMALRHLVVDASATLFSAHVVRGITTSEWGRQYLPAKPRDPYYNRKLGSLYFHSQGISRPGKRLNEVATKFSRSGHMFIDIRSGERLSK
ncbi:unnamed protein product [Candidula unifasciata]|uniref:Uncharacterized protein n=1 Tax=Candidula unifasciata TaxID=100452 RepID=A0A8S4A5I6_9EUPU|nr:unnamed protein product [Candidula unifasciata]